MLVIIYKIACIDEGIKEIYIGSTVNFKKRICRHKYDCERTNSDGRLHRFIRDNGGFDNWKFEKIAEAPFSTSCEKRKFEQLYINLFSPQLNTVAAYTTEEVRKQQAKESRNKHKDEHREKINAYLKEYRRRKKQEHEHERALLNVA